MSEQILGFRIEVRGTEKETASMARLTEETKRMQQSIRLLDKIRAKNGSLTAKQINQRQLLSTQIKANQSDYNKLNKQVLQNNGVTKKNTSFTAKMGKSIVQAGAAMIGITAVIGLVTRLIGGAVKIFVEYEKSNSKLQAVLRLTKKEMVDLKTQSQALGATTAYTASEVVSLQTELAKLGFPKEDIIDMTEATLNGAAALGSELGEQAALTGALLKQYSLEASEATLVNDVLATAAANSALDFNKLSTALPIVGATAAAVGEDLKSTTALLGKLSDRGIDASSAGTSLRNVFLELSKQGLTMEQAMAMINGSTDKAKTSMELFGKRGATAGLILADTTGTVTDLEKALVDTEGAAKIMAETMLDNVAGDVTKAKSAYEGFILSIEDGDGALSKTIRQYTQLSTSILGFLTDLNNGKSFMESWNGIAEQTATTNEQVATTAKVLGVAQGDLSKVIVNNADAYEIMTNKLKNNEITITQFREGISKLAGGFAEAEPSSDRLRSQIDILTTSLKDGKIGIVAYNEELQRLKTKLVDASVKEAEKEKAETQKALDAELAAKVQSEEAKAQAEEDARLKSEAAATKAREKAHADEVSAAEKLAADKEKARAKGQEDGNAFLLEQQRQFNLTERELAKINLEEEYNEKILAITGQSETETELRKQLEIQKKLALDAQKEEFRIADEEVEIERAMLAREMELEAEMIKAAEDLERQGQIQEQQRQLELANKDLTEQEVALINAKYDKMEEENEKARLQNKLRNNAMILGGASDLAGSLSSLAKEGSKEQAALAKAAALMSGAQAIMGILAAQYTGIGFVDAALKAIAIVGVVAKTRQQIMQINSAKLEDGGLVEGASHSQGGIQMYHKSGQHLGEMEGNEYIVSAKRTREIGVENLDAMNFGGASPELNGYHQMGGQVASAGTSQAARSVLSAQNDTQALGGVISEQMQNAIMQIEVKNNAVETFDTALEVENQSTELNFG